MRIRLLIDVVDTAMSRRPPHRRAVASAPHFELQSMRDSTPNRRRCAPLGPRSPHLDLHSMRDSSPIRWCCTASTVSPLVRRQPRRRAVASAPHFDFQSMRNSILSRRCGRCAASTVSSLSLRLRHVGVDRLRAVARAPHLVLQSMRIPPLISSLVAALRAQIRGATFVRGHRAGFGDVSK